MTESLKVTLQYCRGRTQFYLWQPQQPREPDVLVNVSISSNPAAFEFSVVNHSKMINLNVLDFFCLSV